MQYQTRYISLVFLVHQITFQHCKQHITYPISIIIIHLEPPRGTAFLLVSFGGWLGLWFGCGRGWGGSGSGWTLGDGGGGHGGRRWRWQSFLGLWTRCLPHKYKQTSHWVFTEINQWGYRVPSSSYMALWIWECISLKQIISSLSMEGSQ